MSEKSGCSAGCTQGLWHTVPSSSVFLPRTPCPRLPAASYSPLFGNPNNNNLRQIYQIHCVYMHIHIFVKILMEVVLTQVGEGSIWRCLWAGTWGPAAVGAERRSGEKNNRLDFCGGPVVVFGVGGQWGSDGLVVVVECVWVRD